MAAVCATDQYRERIEANPASGDMLMNMDPNQFIDAMSRLKALFEEGAHWPVMGVEEAKLAEMNIPAIVIPGNDNTHSSESGRVAHRLIPGAELHDLGLEDQDLPLVPFDEWAPHEPEITGAFVDFMRRVVAGRDRRYRSIGARVGSNTAAGGLQMRTGIRWFCGPPESVADGTGIVSGPRPLIRMAS